MSSLTKTFVNAMRLVPQTPRFQRGRLMSSGTQECAADNQPRCSKENLEKKPCDVKKQEQLHKSAWYNPACCNNPCIDALPRFDDLYYKESDKRTRTFHPTWIECPKMKIAPRKICCFEKLSLPPMKRRKFSRSKAVIQSKAQDFLNCAALNTTGRCPKLVAPGCAKGRDPPSCKPTRMPSNCKKRCAPYPSYSECSRRKPKPRPPIECRCLIVRPMCNF